jgi:hypothetical protein
VSHANVGRDGRLRGATSTAEVACAFARTEAPQKTHFALVSVSSGSQGGALHEPLTPPDALVPCASNSAKPKSPTLGWIMRSVRFPAGDLMSAYTSRCLCVSAVETPSSAPANRQVGALCSAGTISSYLERDATELSQDCASLVTMCNRSVTRYTSEVYPGHARLTGTGFPTSHPKPHPPPAATSSSFTVNDDYLSGTQSPQPRLSPRALGWGAIRSAVVVVFAYYRRPQHSVGALLLSEMRWCPPFSNNGSPETQNPLQGAPIAIQTPEQQGVTARDTRVGNNKHQTSPQPPNHQLETQHENAAAFLPRHSRRTQQGVLPWACWRG